MTDRVLRGVTVATTHSTVAAGGTLQLGMAANGNRVGGLVINLDGTASLGVAIGPINTATTLEIPLGAGLGFNLASLAQDGSIYKGPVSIDGTTSKAFLVVESTAV